ncbi:MAG: RteC domain-containing protein [Bergeyella sp.]
MDKIEILLQNLTEQLTFIDLEVDDILLKCEKSVEIAVESIQKLKREIAKSGFRSEFEEIRFFKEIKPLFTSKRIYHNSIYRIETKKPSGSTRILKKYYNNELEKLKRYFDDNLDFYKYYRTKSTYLDYKYFVRSSFDIKQSLDNFYYEADLNFTTSHDFKIAKILAHDLLQLYLEDKLKTLERKNDKLNTQRNPNAKLLWTGSKIALTELLYALQTEGVFNNGSPYNNQQKPKYLCFDDLGTETSSKYFGNDCNVMAEILLTRYDLFKEKGILTHITTNLSATEIESQYGNRLRSRMREMFNLFGYEETSGDKRK